MMRGCDYIYNPQIWEKEVKNFVGSSESEHQWITLRIARLQATRRDQGEDTTKTATESSDHDRIYIKGPYYY